MDPLGKGFFGLTADAELYEVFDRILWDWTCLLAKPMAFCGTDEEPLRLARGVRFSGGVGGLLLIQAPESFNHKLASALGVLGVPLDSTRPFDELVNIYSSHVMTELSLMRGHTFDPFLPASLVPGDWPQREPDAACRVYVERQMIQIQLWLEPGRDGPPRGKRD